MEEGDSQFWQEVVDGLGIPLPAPGPVLLIDDDPENLSVLGAVLDDDHEVHLAASGPQALAMLERLGDVSVVLSDQRMPEMTGLEVLAQFARRAPETVRMLVTAYSDVEPVVAAVNQGLVHAFFLKPWDRHEVRAAVADAIGQHRARSALHTLLHTLVGKREDLARTQVELERAQDRLLGAERVNTLGRFTTGVSHSVCNSLALMSSLMTFVRKKPLGPNAVATVEHATTILESLLPVIADVQTFCRGELGQIHRSTVEPHGFLERVRGAFAGTSLGRGRRLNTSVDGNVASVVIDAGRVQQALIAVLAHAADASDHDRPLALHLRRGADNGCRFEITYGPAFRSDASRAADDDNESVTPGLGFGIEMAREIALAHGGRLELGAQVTHEARTSLWLGPAAPNQDRR